MADKLDKGKKRKRHTDGSEKPSKKVAIEADKSDKFSFAQDGDKWAPVIASTPGLALPTQIPLQPYTKPRGKESQHSGPIATTELLLHSNAHPRLDYLAREEESGRSGALLKHYVGIYDPDTGKLEVVEARRMVVRGSVREHQATAEDQIAMNIREQRNELGQTFGTKKAKKAIASVTENAIGPSRAKRNGETAKLDSGAAAVIASMAEATAGMATREQLREEADAAKPRPKANTKTLDIREVYTVGGLIGTDIFKNIPTLDWADAVQNQKEVRVNSRFVANRIQKLASKNEKLKILRYMYVLIEVHNISKPGREGRKLPKREDVKSALGQVPEVLVESVKRKFTDAGILSKYKVDLLITHICALACLVDNYEVDMWDLRQDLKLELKEMAQYFHEIGAKIGALPEATRKTLGLDKAVAAQRKVAKLKIPLEFPRVAFARRAR